MAKRRKLPNGIGSITELKDRKIKKFWARKTIGWNINGNPIRKSIGTFHNYNDAYNFLMQLHNDNYNLNFLNITTEELFKLAIKHKMRSYENKEEGKKTYNRYTSTFKNYYCPFYKRKFINLILENIQNIIDYCGHGYDTKSNIKSTYNLMYDYAKMNGAKLPDNFTKYLELGEQKKSTLHSCFTLKEINLLWDNLYKIPHIELVLICIYTGLRPTELCKIEIKNVFLEEHYMIGGIKTAAGKNRIIPICDKIMPLIEKLYNKNNKFLIDSQSDKPIHYNTLKERIRKSCEILGINHKPHDGRHTFETLLSEKGVSEAVRNALMGHEQEGIGNKVYNHISLELKLQAVNSLNKLS